jgi:hypothetical protein
MENQDELCAELVRLLSRQATAIELEVYVGLTDAEWREYDKREKRIRDLNARLDQSQVA